MFSAKIFRTARFTPFENYPARIASRGSSLHTLLRRVRFVFNQFQPLFEKKRSLCTFWHTSFLCFQQLPASFLQTPGVGGAAEFSGFRVARRISTS
jgi:hypothetical protein